MKAMRYLSAITMLILALAITQPVAAQSFEPNYAVGVTAYYERDFVTARKHFEPLAKQGDAISQGFLGQMYENGEGLLQDSVMAYVWYNISATRGNNFSRRERDKIRETLTASELKLARKLSKLCLKNPAKCPEYSDD
jgi:TPR repeat protein